MTSDSGIRFLLPAALAAAVLLLAVACGGPPAAEPTAPGGEDGAAADVSYAPDFALEDLDGNLVRLSDSAGKVRLIDFWATWCAPCREEVPMFKELQERYGGDGFLLLAVSMDEEGADVVRDFVKEYEISYTNLLGNDEVAAEFGGVLGLPTAFLVDGEGRIVKEYFGPKPKKKVETKIRELLGLGPAA